MKFGSATVPESLRIIMGGMFLFMAINKISGLINHGLRPYRDFVHQLGWSDVLAYYGVFAIIIEMLMVFGLWYWPLFKTAICLSVVLTSLGAGVSVYSLIYRLNSDCGCGLLGTNEYGLLGQKLIIGAALVYLYVNRQLLDFD